MGTIHFFIYKILPTATVVGMVELTLTVDWMMKCFVIAQSSLICLKLEWCFLLEEMFHNLMF